LIHTNKLAPASAEPPPQPCQDNLPSAVYPVFSLTTGLSPQRQQNGKITLTKKKTREISPGWLLAPENLCSA